MTRKVHVGILAATIFAALSTAASTARAEVDVGVFSGFRGFGEEAGLLVLDDRFLFGGRVGVVFGGFGIEAEGAFVPTHRRSSDTSITGLGIRGHLRYVFNQDGFARPFILAGFGAFLRSGGGSAVDNADSLPRGKSTTEGHLGAGFELYFTDTFGLRVDGRAYWPTKEDFAVKSFNWEVLFGVQLAFGKPKAAPPPPPPPPDADNDGVPDDQDKCPTEPGPPENQGCPIKAPEVPKDRDNDGIPDDQDACPDDAGPATTQGCPDADNDGVPDKDDKCPKLAGPKEHQGCPDSDGDGIFDDVDKCPNEQGPPENQGCPVPAAVKKFIGVIKGVNFATGKATLTKGSFKVLDEAAKVLTEYPTISLEISGHTDDTGKHDMNVTLSQARADAVKAYLVGKGVADARLKSVGYGPDKPLVPGKSAKARAANRRVEFQLTTQ